MEIRLLTINDVAAYRELRLRALREDPESFGSSYEEEARHSVAELTERFRAQWSDENFIVGVFEGGQLLGITGFFRKVHIKERHKGMIWGVYVVPEARGRGLARLLMDHVLQRVRSLDGVERVQLAVVTINTVARTMYTRLGFFPYGLEHGALKIGSRYLDEELLELDLHDQVRE